MMSVGPFLAFAVALAVTLVAIPFILRIAHRRELLDQPDGDRHAHTRAVPRLGGIAVFAGFVTALLIAWLLQTLTSDIPRLPHALALVFGTAILFGVGLLDDLYGVSPALKLSGQTVAALVVIASGFTLQTISLPPSVTIDLGWMGVPLTVLWLVGISNAFNLIDGLDGLAGGVGMIAVATIAISAGILDRPFSALCAASLAGALLGFLRYNLPPARIFLGDSGSLTVGFLLAYITLRGAMRPDGSLLTVIPLFALAYPLLDTSVAMLRRWLRGHPFSRADGRHIHHQLRAVGLTDKRAIVLIYFHAAIAAVVGLFVAFSNPGITVAIAAGTAVVVYFAVFGVRRLKYHEFLEAGGILVSSFSRARVAIRDTINSRDVAEEIEHARSVAEINDILSQNAALFRFAQMSVGALSARGTFHTPNTTRSHLQVPLHASVLSPTAWWSVDYPINRQNGDAVLDQLGDPIVLTLACPTSSAIRAAAVDRVAPILAAAIASWSETHAEPLRLEVPDRPARAPHVPRSMDSAAKVHRKGGAGEADAIVS